VNKAIYYYAWPEKGDGIMGFVLLFRNENGQVEYFNKIFSSEAEAFEFTRVHRITDYEILSEQEFQAWIQSQQQSSSQQQRRSGYQQHVNAVVDETEEEPRQMSPRPVFVRNYRPAFISFPSVKKKNRRWKNYGFQQMSHMSIW
jgi:hypothetical protein